MLKPTHWTALLITALLSATHAVAQSRAIPPKEIPPEAPEPIAILELGAQPQHDLTGGNTLGPTLAAEITPIDHWLEIEAGVTRLFGNGQREWDTDLLFKKPYTLSRSAEFMFGIGPEWQHVTANGRTTNSIAAEAALDFMFWPSPKRRFGWYLEPAYDYSFSSGHDQSLSLSGGLLIPIPHRSRH